MEVGSVAVLVRDARDAWESLRSALGLALEGRRMGWFWLGRGLDLGDHAEDFAQSLEMLAWDLEGRAATSDPEAASAWEPLDLLASGELAALWAGYDLVIPFGE